MPKKAVIDKATIDKPAHVPIDLDQRAVLVIYHRPTNLTIRTRGWTLNEVLSILGWKTDEIWAAFRAPWARDRGAFFLTPSPDPEGFLAKLNPGKEVE